MIIRTMQDWSAWKGKTLRSALIASTLMLLAGCAATPLPVDLHGSERVIDRKLAAAAPEVSDVVVQNMAPPAKLVNTPLGGDTLVPINTAEITSATVENDIKRYFSETTHLNPSSNEKLVVRIERAEAYWVWGGADKIPFVGLLTVGTDKDFYIKLKVTFEVEERGKVARSYTFDDRITIPGKAATTGDIVASYQRLVRTYREKFFARLDGEFTHRYL